MEISYLADHPDFVEVLAPWIFEYWKAFLPQDKLETRIEKLQGHMHYDRLPVAFVAHEENQVLGTAALRVCDLPGKEELSPWLGGVFVGEDYRGNGIGKELCRSIEVLANSLYGNIPLYLFTLDRQPWYRSMGWIEKEPCCWGGEAGHVMVKQV